MPNNTRHGLVAAISLGGVMKHARTGTDPRAVLESLMPLVAEHARDGLRKKLAAAIEQRPDTALNMHGMYFQDWVKLAEGDDLSGWFVVFPVEVMS